MARAIALDLVEGKVFSQVTLADIDVERAQALASTLPTPGAETLRLDLRDEAQLVKALGDHDVVINSTWYRLNPHVMGASIRAGVPYVDLGGLYHVTLKQLEMNKEAVDRGVTCLIGMGSTPGTMNVMAAYAADQLASVDEVLLGSASKVVRPGRGFQVPYSLGTMLDEATMPAVVFEEGAYKEVPPLAETVPMDMPDPIGRVEGYLTLHSELATMPQNVGKGLRRLSFALHLPKDYVSYLRTLVNLGLASREPVDTPEGPLTPYDFLVRVLGRAKPEQVELDVDVQMAEVHGRRGEEEVTVRVWAAGQPRKDRELPGGTWGTGVPASICAMMIGRGDIQAKGVVPPEVAVEPLPFFGELRKRGIEVGIETRSKRHL